MIRAKIFKAPFYYSLSYSFKLRLGTYDATKDFGKEVGEIFEEIASCECRVTQPLESKWHTFRLHYSPICLFERFIWP